MQLNNYNFYSRVVQNEVINNDELDKVSNLIRNFDEVWTIDDAKEFLLRNWKISKDITRAPIGGNYFININEDDIGLEVNFEHNKEKIIYYYNK